MTVSFSTFEDIEGIGAPALSPAGSGRIYFDNVSNKFQVSENGGAYVDMISAAVASGWTDDGTVVRLTTITDQVGIGTAVPVAGSAMEVVGGVRFTTAGNNFGVEVFRAAAANGIF